MNGFSIITLYGSGGTKGGVEVETTRYGIYSTVSKRYIFGISEPSKTKARKALFNLIGKDAYKWRFEVRKVNDQIFENQRKHRQKQRR